MTEALTGGFDSCLEVGAALLDLQAEPGVALAASHLQNLVLPLTGGGPLAGTVRLLFSQADVFPAGDFNDGEVTVQLIGTIGLEITAPSPDRQALSVRVHVSGLPLVLSPPETRDGQTQSEFAVNLSAFTVQVQADALGEQGLDDLAGRLGVSPDVVTSAVASTLQADLAVYVASMGQAGSLIPIPGTAVQFSPVGQPGRLSQDQSQTFVTGLAMATRAGTNGSPAVLCVLSDLFEPPAPTGDPATKTAVATTFSTSGAVTITAAAAQRFVLCPSAFSALLPMYLGEVLLSGILDGLQPTDIPGFDDSDQDLATAISKGQVANFFNIVLPAGLPPVSYLSVLGQVVWDRLPGPIQVLLSDTDAAMAAILPSQCGTAGDFPLPDSRLTALELGLIADNITVAGVVAPHVWGIDGNVKFSTSMFVSIDINGNVILTPGAVKTDSSIGLEWYAVVLGAFIGAFFGAIGGLTGGLALGVAFSALGGAVAGTVISLTAGVDFLSKVITNLVVSHLTQALANLAPPMLPLPFQTVPTAIAISPEGMTLWFGLMAGAPAFPPPLQVPLPTLTMSEQIIQSAPVPAGTGKQTIVSQCVNGTFSYQDFTLTTLAIFSVQATALTPPLSYQWMVDGFPVQPPPGQLPSADPSHDMLISFSPDLTQMTLLNLPGSPTYSRLVQCVATGADGISAEATGGATFTGFQRIFEPSYGEALGKCLATLIAELRQLGVQPVSGDDTGPVTAAGLAALIASLVPGGEGDPQAGSLGLLDAALHMGDLPGMAAARLTLAQAAEGSPEGNVFSAGLEP